MISLRSRASLRVTSAGEIARTRAPLKTRAKLRPPTPERPKAGQWHWGAWRDAARTSLQFGLGIAAVGLLFQAPALAMRPDFGPSSLDVGTAAIALVVPGEQASARGRWAPRAGPPVPCSAPPAGTGPHVRQTRGGDPTGGARCGDRPAVLWRGQLPGALGDFARLRSDGRCRSSAASPSGGRHRSLIAHYARGSLVEDIAKSSYRSASAGQQATSLTRFVKNEIGTPLFVGQRDFHAGRRPYTLSSRLPTYHPSPSTVRRGAPTSGPCRSRGRRFLYRSARPAVSARNLSTDTRGDREGDLLAARHEPGGAQAGSDPHRAFDSGCPLGPALG